MYGKQVRSNLYISRTYRIEERLGSGGNCTVYKAWHNRLRKYVVIKVTENCFEDVISRHRNEIEALKNIKSMYLPQVIDFLVCDDQSFTILEHVEGKSFDNLIKYGCIFTEMQVLKWYKQLAFALRTIHMHDICHRDIKPANIVLSTSEDICLIDFNSALVMGNNTGVASSSMGYASPEQYKYFMTCREVANGKQTVFLTSNETQLLVSDCMTEQTTTPQLLGSSRIQNSTCPTAALRQVENVHGVDWKLSDIFSLGATMYHLLTGERPLSTPEELQNISEMKGYNREIMAIIERSMEALPSQRFQSAERLYAALERIVIE